MPTTVTRFEDVPEEFIESLPPSPTVKVALLFTKNGDKEKTTDDGLPTVSFDATVDRSGLIMVKIGDAYTASAVEFSGVKFYDNKLHGPHLHTVGMMSLKCPRCGTVVIPASDVIKNAKRCGVKADSVKEALAQHRTCPSCKLERLVSARYLDIAGAEGESVFGKEAIDRLKKACDEAKDPFVIPPVVACLPDPTMAGSSENEIPGEFPDLMSEVIKRAAEFKYDGGDFPMRIVDACVYTPKMGHVCLWQIVMPECYSGLMMADTIDKGVHASEGMYRVDLQVFLKRFLETPEEKKEKKRKYADEEAGKKRRPPRHIGL